jgi:1-acyl-sn-glycerol-3-phosphate acyltransferase
MSPSEPTTGTAKPLTDPNLVYRTARVIAHGLIHTFGRVQVEGHDNFPAGGPYLLVINHLHLLDVPTVFTIVPHQVAVIAYEGWANHRVAGGTMRAVTKVIPINPQKLDHRSLTEAMDWLRAGGVIGIAPEGKRSKSGELLAGQPGTAYLASRTGVPIVPVVAWGQERAFGEIKSLRRPQIFIRVGQPFVLPGTPSRARTPELMEHTRMIMRVMADMLPESYRGAYREVEGDQGSSRDEDSRELEGLELEGAR